MPVIVLTAGEMVYKITDVQYGRPQLKMCHNLVSCMMNRIKKPSSLGVGALYTSPMAESKLMQERLELALQCRDREGPA